MLCGAGGWGWEPFAYVSSIQIWGLHIYKKIQAFHDARTPLEPPWQDFISFLSFSGRKER